VKRRGRADREDERGLLERRRRGAAGDEPRKDLTAAVRLYERPRKWIVQRVPQEHASVLRPHRVPCRDGRFASELESDHQGNDEDDDSEPKSPPAGSCTGVTLIARSPCTRG
jgi:hypothetical protein